MDILANFLDIFLHLDRHLEVLIAAYGLWTYLILFAIVFCETGLVVTPFLPGDSLLFAAGSFAALGALDPMVLWGSLILAGVLGDGLNYAIGYRLGPKVFYSSHQRLFKREHLLRTQAFYERHGGKTIVIARFMPIIRTFAPFVAGIGKMRYVRFAAYNVVGAVLWVTAFIWGGYLFGNLPAVRDNFTAVILAIVVISVLPGVVRVIQSRHR